MFSPISMRLFQCIYSLESNFRRKSEAKEVEQGCLDNVLGLELTWMNFMQTTELICDQNVRLDSENPSGRNTPVQGRSHARMSTVPWSLCILKCQLHFQGLYSLPEHSEPSQGQTRAGFGRLTAPPVCLVQSRPLYRSFSRGHLDHDCRPQPLSWWSFWGTGPSKNVCAFSLVYGSALSFPCSS